ncbi:hypothetical protein ABPG72_011691 [Tetrahymena utriculariae]
MLSKLFKTPANTLYSSMISRAAFSNISKSKTEESITHMVNYYLDQAAEHTDIPKDKMNFYKNCDGVVQINIPLKRENGKFETIKAFRVQHKTHCLPTKGGFIINDQVSKEDIQSFAVLNTVRSTTLDLPYGGAKGAICINPKEYTENELELIIRRFTLEAAKKNIIGSSVDVLGTDLGASEREMNWIKDTFTTLYGQEDIHAIACVTGKGLNQGGLKGYVESPGYGLYYTLKYILQNKEFLEKTGLTEGLKGKTFVIEGFGSVGYWAAHHLQEAGAILVGVCEHDGQIYNPQGIDANELNNYMKKYKGVKGFPHANEQENVSYSKCDFFIPCFFAQSINAENADKFQCKVVVEGANLPTTPSAEKILKEKGIEIIPDIIASSGGFLASYFEWCKNINHTQHGAMTRKWEEKSNYQLLETIEGTTGLRLVSQAFIDHVEEIRGASERDLVISGIEESFENALNETIETSKKYGVSLRCAAYINSLNKLHGHYEQVGITFSK